MSSTRFAQQHIIELNEKPASSLLMNKELQNIYKGTNELDDEAKIHRAKQADPTLADTATEKHVTNAQTKKWEDTANTFSGVSPSSFVAATEVVTTATANKILKLNADGKLPTDIVGNATTASDSLLLNGKSDTAFQAVVEKDQPGGYAGLDATGKIPGELLNIADPMWGNISGTLSDQTDLQTALDGKANASHSHNDLYYTETEVDTKLAGKANTSHSHSYAPIPSSSSLPVGTWVTAFNMSSPAVDVANGSTIAGSNLKRVKVEYQSSNPVLWGAALSGTWKNISGESVSGQKSVEGKTHYYGGLFVRIA